ncbi:hypothetical protein Tco_0732707 [Tanacetum coccineum]
MAAGVDLWRWGGHGSDEGVQMEMMTMVSYGGDGDVVETVGDVDGRVRRCDKHGVIVVMVMIWMRYRGTSELILDTDSKGNELGDDDTDEDRRIRIWARIMRERDTAASRPLGLGYGALRRRELAVGEDQVPSTFEVGQSSRSMLERQGAERTPSSLEWSSGSLPISPSSSVVLSPISSLVATPIATILVDEDQFLEILIGMSLEREWERVAVTFGALWRPVLALEAWAGQTDTQRAALWHAIYDTQRENHDLRM